MRRKLSLVLAFIGVIGLVGFAPVAQADHDQGDKPKEKAGGEHESMPFPRDPNMEGGICEVDGSVQIGDSKKTGGVDAEGANHNHYLFGEETVIACQQIPGGSKNVTRYTDEEQGLFTQYEVAASGGTDGLNPINGEHGESDANGWSHKSCYAGTVAAGDCDAFGYDSAGKTDNGLEDLYDGTNVNTGNGCANCGEIEVRSAQGTKISVAEDSDGDGVPDSENWVKFCRGLGMTQDGQVCPAVGPQNVIAWGALTNIGSDDGTKVKDEVLCFWADLEFAPNPEQIGSKITEARLDGIAFIWTEIEKDLCAGKKGKKKDPNA